MKFITVCVIVCAMALKLSFNCASPQRLPRSGIYIPRTTNDRSYQSFIPNNLQNVSEYESNSQRPPTPVTFRTLGDYLHFADATLKNLSSRHYNDVLIGRINATWLKCNETFFMTGNRIDIFSANEVQPGDRRARKCLVECTLRVLGVLKESEDDEDSEESEHSDGSKTDYEQIIEQLKTLNPSLDISDMCDLRFSDLCHLIYDSECLELRDPHGDNCESSWMIMGCMLRRNQQKFFNIPFRSIFAKKVPSSRQMAG